MNKTGSRTLKSKFDSNCSSGGPKNSSMYEIDTVLIRKDYLKASSICV